MQKKQGKRRPRIRLYKKNSVNGGVGSVCTKKTGQTEGQDQPEQKKQGKRKGRIRLCIKKLGKRRDRICLCLKKQGERRGRIWQMFFFRAILGVRSGKFFFPWRIFM